MNIREMISHLNSGKKIRRKNWLENEFLIKGEVVIKNSKGNILYAYPKIYKSYDKDLTNFSEWFAETDDLYTYDWEVLKDNFDCKKKFDKKEKYYTTSEIAKELNCSANFLFKFLVKNGIVYYDKKKKLYIVGDAYSEYVNYKVNYGKYKKLHLMWNEKGKKWLVDYVTFNNSVEYINSINFNSKI